MADEKEIKEIRIKKVTTLSETAKREVTMKLRDLNSADIKFDYQGYAKVSYVEGSPLQVSSIDPIEGTIVDIFDVVMGNIKK